jgi:tetratricopeptide (TPR) repeat protein
VAIDRAAALKNAEKLLRQGKLDQAIEEYTRVVDEQPADWNTRNALGDLLVRAGQLPRAVAEFTQIADAFKRDGFYSKAAALYRRILKLAPDDEHAMFHGAEAAAAQGLLADARAGFGALLQRYRGQGDRRSELQLTARMAALDPADLEARVQGAQALVELGDRRGALAALKSLAEYCREKQKTDVLLRVLEFAASLDPDDRTLAAPATRAQVDRAAGDDAQPPARAEVEPVAAPAPMDIRPEAPPAPAADAPPERGPRRGPEPIVERAADPTPAPPRGSTVATAQHRSKNIEVDLSVVLDEIRKVAPGESSAAPDLEDVFAQMRLEAGRRLAIQTAEQDYRRGVALFQAGQVEDSIAALEAASAAPRFRFEAAALLGRIFLNRGDLGRAIQWLERAREAPAPAPEGMHKVLYDLADTLEATGNAAGALAVLLELQSAAGVFRDVAARVKRLSSSEIRG